MTSVVITQKREMFSVDLVMSSVRLRKTYFVHIATATTILDDGDGDDDE